jgi:hypothetical protein
MPPVSPKLDVPDVNKALATPGQFKTGFEYVIPEPKIL